MSLIETVYASAPAQYVIIPTLEIKHADIDTIRICADYADHVCTLEDDSVVTFEQSAFDYQLPNKDTSGNQTLQFAIDNVMGVVQEAVDAILAGDGQSTLTYREYLNTDLSAPAAPPIVMTIIGVAMQGGVAQISAAYYDLLNTAWPRKRYTADFAPGIKYL